jgi:short subunit dehydrogenase-like uncharacterized protein
MISSSGSSPPIVVYGATGTTGALVCKALARRGAAFAIAGRNREKLEALAAELGVDVPVRVAAIDDVATLGAAFAGAKVVASCAGPFNRIGEPVVAAAIEAGCHYVDTAGEQGFLRDMYERYGGAAARRGVVSVSALAFEIALGDWAAAWAAAILAGESGDGRIAEDDPLDEVTVAYAVEDPATSAATQRTHADMLFQPGWVWQGEQWDPAPLGAEQRTINFGPELGGERPAQSFPSGEVITIPRHVNARRVQTYLSLTRSRWVGALARAATRIAPALYRTRAAALIDSALAQVTTSGGDSSRTRFAVVARAVRRFSMAQVRVLGTDPYALTGELIADAVVDLAAHAPRAVGACAPSEVWPAEASLRALVDTAGLTVEAA